MSPYGCRLRVKTRRNDRQIYRYVIYVTRTAIFINIEIDCVLIDAQSTSTRINGSWEV